jgi:hypothetical protein
MKTWIALIMCCLLAGFAGSFTLMRIAEAQGLAAVDAVAAPAPDGVSSSPQIVGVNWNPLDWDWPWILTTLAMVLGGIIALLRPIALATKWTGDNWLLARLEYVLALLMRVFVPKDYPKFPDQKTASLGGGKAPGSVS